MAHAPELLQLAEPSSILRALECPICTNIALPALVTCENGHFVCEACRAQTAACGLCKGQYTTARNIAIEQIVRASTFVCRFHAEGCNRRVLGDEYKLHLSKCNYRNITCNCYYGNHCQGVSIAFNRYIDHLLEHHKFEKRTQAVTSDEEGVGVDAGKGVSTLDFTSSMRGRVFEWTPLVITYAGRFFIARRRLLNGLLTIWVSLFGPDEDARDYQTEISVCNSDPDVQVPRVTWNVAVHACRRDWAEIDDSVLCVSVPFQQLKQIGSRKDGKLVWKINFVIRPNAARASASASESEGAEVEVDSDYESRLSPAEENESTSTRQSQPNSPSTEESNLGTANSAADVEGATGATTPNSGNSGTNNNGLNFKSSLIRLNQTLEMLTDTNILDLNKIL